MAKNDLSSWLQYLEKSHPKSIDLGLERVQTVAKYLGPLNFTCPVITTAGTNGKGSCVATLEAIFSTQGYRTGAYFSPHLQQYNERVRLDGNKVSDEALCDAFTAIDAARRGISLSYFEWGTLAALWLLQRAQPDIVILEVGLGGRLDAVNIIDSDVAVITTIDLDHTEWLGPDREAIGREKAGIFRVEKPIVCGDLNPPQSIIERALALKAPLYRQGIDFSYEIVGQQWRFCRGKYRSSLLPMPHFILQNVAAALMTIDLLKTKMPVSVKSIKEGLNKAFLPGRLQVFLEKPLVILDVAHNPQGCRKLYEKMTTLPVTGKTYAVTGMLKDKDHKQNLTPLLPIIDAWYVAALPGERGFSAQQMEKTLSHLGASIINVFDSVITAYKTALNHAKSNDRIIVFGSFRAVGPVLSKE
jgi:dihydrofolate synthase/folylpolyglutamate synthase